MKPYENPELRALLDVYSDSTSPDRGSVADHLTALVLAEHAADPLIVATATDLAVFPGDGRPPEVRGFRLNIPGFTELTAISHLGPAIGTLVALERRGAHELWRSDAARLVEVIRGVRLVNGPALWRDGLGISSFAGREHDIATMVEYACELAQVYLLRALGEPGYLTPASLASDYLDVGSERFPVSGNKLMVATFALYGLDHVHRWINWFHGLGIDWARALVAITGRQGRPTAGTTKSTTSLVRLLRHISHDELALTRVFVAPTLAGFESPTDGDLAAVGAVEGPLRWQLARVMSSMELAPVMFGGYPAFVEPPLLGPELSPGASEVSEFPPVRAADDWHTMITRLRLTLEDPRQLLAAGVTDFIAERLVAAGNDPRAVVIPGLDTETYPRGR
ncbi:DUF5624 domain-containing protein [Microbacterium deminutum]|uniref:DUF5624 domain-containing protein n=1 Tax=Microbacterium deminutum TaxID=344164 RepID=A0ABP5BE72_9MICO